jgi:hypothetical protein
MANGFLQDLGQMGAGKPCPRLETSRNQLVKNEKCVLDPINELRRAHIASLPWSVTASENVLIIA